MTMERADIFNLMGELKLYGMRGAYDEVMTTSIKRQHEPPKTQTNVCSLCNSLTARRSAQGRDR